MDYSVVSVKSVQPATGVMDRIVFAVRVTNPCDWLFPYSLPICSLIPEYLGFTRSGSKQRFRDGDTLALAPKARDSAY